MTAPSERAWLDDSEITIDDRPHEDIAAVVAGAGHVSNRLVMYVRLMMAVSRRSTERLLDGFGTPPKVEREDIAAEVFEMCVLEEHGEREQARRDAAWAIAGAAGWCHLAGEDDS